MAAAVLFAISKSQGFREGGTNVQEHRTPRSRARNVSLTLTLPASVQTTYVVQ